MACVGLCVHVDTSLLNGVSFPHHKALGYLDLQRHWWDMSLNITLTSRGMYMEARGLGWFHGGCFCSFLWSLCFCCVRWRFKASFPISAWEGHRPRDGLRGKRHWMIEITQFLAAQCKRVGAHLCLPQRWKGHLWSGISCLYAPLEPRLSLRLKGREK